MQVGLMISLTASRSQLALATLPEDGAPQQLAERWVQTRAADTHVATRCGAGTVRDPPGATREGDIVPDVITDMSSDASHTEVVAKGSAGSAGQLASKLSHSQRDQCETPL